jgi:hypothetical protein
MIKELQRLKKEEKKLKERVEEGRFNKSLIGLSKEQKKEAKEGRKVEKAEKRLKQLKYEKAYAITDSLSNKAEKLIMALGKLGKPKAKLPSYSAKGFIRQMGSGNIKLVKPELPKKEFEEPRSLFFQEEFIKERNRSLL